jgi:hypothetical protein
MTLFCGVGYMGLVRGTISFGGAILGFLAVDAVNALETCLAVVSIVSLFLLSYSGYRSVQVAGNNRQAKPETFNLL